MKTPNDIKRRNSNSGSVGQFMRWRERLVHVSAQPVEHPDYVAARRSRNKMALALYTGPLWKVIKGNGKTYNVGSNNVKRTRRIVKHGKRIHRRGLLPYQREAMNMVMNPDVTRVVIVSR